MARKMRGVHRGRHRDHEWPVMVTRMNIIIRIDPERQGLRTVD